MAKMIKFDLPIDGVWVASVDDLKGHFTDEIIRHYHTGLLSKWLKCRGLNEERQRVEALVSGDDADTLKQLCEIFEVEADDDIIALVVKKDAGTPGMHIESAQERVLTARSIAEEVLALDFKKVSDALERIGENKKILDDISIDPFVDRSLSRKRNKAKKVLSSERRKVYRFRRQVKTAQDRARVFLSYLPNDRDASERSEVEE